VWTVTTDGVHEAIWVMDADTTNKVQLTTGEAQDWHPHWGIISPVPVVLASFQAKGSQGFIALNWVTASEFNSHRWEVHRSERENGQYAKVGELPGYGSTETAHTYQWVDRQVSPGLTYFYKLKQVVLMAPRGGRIQFLLLQLPLFPRPTLFTRTIQTPSTRPPRSAMPSPGTSM